jgi:hypothetical protein
MSGGKRDTDSSEPPAIAGGGAGSAREHAAWRSWLSAMASDAEAAMAAALAYESLSDEARDAWLDALLVDAPLVHVPRVALYAPLLAVESNERRRDRIVDALALAQTPPATRTRAGARALRGENADGRAVCVILSPLYLDFVELLACAYDVHEGIAFAKHEPLCHRDQVATRAQSLLGDVTLTPAVLPDVVEELAHAVVADKRRGRDAPSAVVRFTHLFGPDIDHSDSHGSP